MGSMKSLSTLWSPRRLWGPWLTHNILRQHTKYCPPYQMVHLLLFFLLLPPGLKEEQGGGEESGELECQRHSGAPLSSLTLLLHSPIYSWIPEVRGGRGAMEVQLPRQSSAWGDLMNGPAPLRPTNHQTMWSTFIYYKYCIFHLSSFRYHKVLSMGFPGNLQSRHRRDQRFAGWQEERMPSSAIRDGPFIGAIAYGGGWRQKKKVVQTIWNSLPLSLRTAPFLKAIWWGLKELCFRFTFWVWWFLMLIINFMGLPFS